ncbi:MAG: lipoyl synthase [Ignavibacteria bacterium]|nr:lipoyl synthase [Ignavibacteria bacterium]
MINTHQKKYKELIETSERNLGKRPDWLRVKMPSGENYIDVLNLVKNNNLNTVCEEARCPNIAECWNNRTATFMILGEICTRSCGFCSVKTGMPSLLDTDEPRRVAEAVNKLNLSHCVITSVDRDELEDGGASIYSATVNRIRELNPNCTVEILIPDFKGDEKSFEIIMQNPPDILSHNVETVPKLYDVVRPQAKYSRSLELLQWFKHRNLRTKSGLMVGIGETNEEVNQVLIDLFNYGCEIVTIGQYLQPTKAHLPVQRFVSLEDFRNFKQVGLKIGLKIVESAPLVRSSYHADKHTRENNYVQIDYNL